MERADVVVLGGGIVGLCCAHYLQAAGADVVLLDAGQETRGSSMGNTGLVSPSKVVPLASPGAVAQGVRWLFNRRSPFYIKPRPDPALYSWLWRFHRNCNQAHVDRSMQTLKDLIGVSAELTRELAGSLGFPFDYIRKGMIMLCETEKALARETALARTCRDMGLDVQVLSQDEIREMEHPVDIRVLGGILYHDDGCLSPDRLIKGLWKDLAARGVRLLSDAEVLGFKTLKNRVLEARTSTGPIQADDFVLATGAWSPRLLRPLGLHLPLQPAKGYSLTLNDAPLLPRHAYIMAEAKVAVTPLGRRLRIAGTLELCGLNLSINPLRVEAIRTAARRVAPNLIGKEFDVLTPWRGLRACSHDGFPFVGRFRAIPNLIAATGHSMMGVGLAPITGKLISEITGGRQASLPLHPLEPDRAHKVK